jgi:predicted nucleotidyltransferase
VSETVHAIIKELRRRLEALYGPRLVRMVLYGSQARGEAELGSDIDVLIVLQGVVSPGEEIARTSDIIAALSLKHGVVLSRAFVSSDRFEHEQSPLLRNIRREGVAV